ncbi:MAG: hypothetical protein HFG15_03590 [Bacilli bacterium]|nr:hypothetical protein [Bacilli bacterium]
MRVPCKKVILFGILLLFLISGYFSYRYLRVKFAKVLVTLVENREIAFHDKKKISDFIVNINGTLLDDAVIPTTTLGKQDVTFTYMNDDHIKVTYTYQVEVVDQVTPVIWLGPTYRIPKGTNDDLASSIMCGDNHDAKPTCYIEGDYDPNQVGTYSLVYKASDQSGNEAQQPFELIVYDPDELPVKPTEKSNTPFADVVKTYKTDRTRIGIDVSAWQGDIDFAKLKAAGVEFVMIRIGGNSNTEEEYFLDKKFHQNITRANQHDIDVGVYFYSYANSLEQARKDAKWVLNQIKDYKVTLPIAFDWEEWENFNQYHLSFFGLTSMAEVFLKEVELAGYQGMLYSSKAYLEEIWFPTKYDIWLAHYTKQTDYTGNYRLWQICDNGVVDGINGDVDINILYE